MKTSMGVRGGTGISPECGFLFFCKGGLGDEGLDLKNLLNVCPVSTTENFVVTGHSYNTWQHTLKY